MRPVEHYIFKQYIMLGKLYKVKVYNKSFKDAMYKQFLLGYLDNQWINSCQYNNVCQASIVSKPWQIKQDNGSGYNHMLLNNDNPQIYVTSEKVQGLSTDYSLDKQQRASWDWADYQINQCFMGGKGYKIEWNNNI